MKVYDYMYMYLYRVCGNVFFLSFSQHSYLKNISTFLHICETKFRLKESDLFVESDLYDVDNFQKVCSYAQKLNCLSRIVELGSSYWCKRL